jgi:hypothetical protein
MDLIKGLSAQYRKNITALYENQQVKGNWLNVDVHNSENQTEIGSCVTVSVNGRNYTRVKNSKSDYFSQSTRILHFGLGEADSVNEVRVQFPNGESRVYEDVGVNQSIDVYPE